MELGKVKAVTDCLGETKSKVGGKGVLTPLKTRVHIAQKDGMECNLGDGWCAHCWGEAMALVRRDDALLLGNPGGGRERPLLEESCLFRKKTTELGGEKRGEGLVVPCGNEKEFHR